MQRDGSFYHSLIKSDTPKCMDTIFLLLLTAPGLFLSVLNIMILINLEKPQLEFLISLVTFWI